MVVIPLFIYFINFGLYYYFINYLLHLFTLIIIESYKNNNSV